VILNIKTKVLKRYETVKSRELGSCEVVSHPTARIGPSSRCSRLLESQVAGFFQEDDSHGSRIFIGLDMPTFSIYHQQNTHIATQALEDNVFV